MQNHPSPNEPAEEYLPTHRSLLARLKQWDDQEAWREFFVTYWKLIYSVALKAGLNPVEAEDIVQDTIIGVARKMPRFTYDPALGSFKAFLLLNVRSRIADFRRKAMAEKRRVARLETGSGSDLLECVPDPALSQLDAVWEAEWHKHLFEAAVEKVKSEVSAKQYLIFDLSVVKQVPVSQITSSLGVNAAQVYLARHRVSRALRAQVQRLTQGPGST
jgi:RNA polymerase sigma factor (sigma-70 family)